MRLCIPDVACPLVKPARPRRHDAPVEVDDLQLFLCVFMYRCKLMLSAHVHESITTHLEDPEQQQRRDQGQAVLLVLHVPPVVVPVPVRGLVCGAVGVVDLFVGLRMYVCSFWRRFLCANKGSDRSESRAVTYRQQVGREEQEEEEVDGRLRLEDRAPKRPELVVDDGLTHIFVLCWGV